MTFVKTPVFGLNRVRATFKILTLRDWRFSLS